MKLLIESDGTANGTRVSDAASGEPVEHVTRIVIKPITPDTALHAEVTTFAPQLRLTVAGKVLRTENAHQSVKVGRFRIYKHDYDGAVLQVVDEESKPPQQQGILEKQLESILRNGLPRDQWE